MALPGLISERLFSLFDLDHDGQLSRSEFVNGTSRLFNSSFEENVKLIFAMFDFDSIGIASKEDIRTLLSHVPMSEILTDMNLTVRKEGQYTKSGGGLYSRRTF